MNIINAAARPIGKIFGPGRLARENKVLSKRVNMLEARVAALKDVEQENIRLKKLLDMRSEAAPRTIAAGIIAKSVSSWSFSVVLDKGSRAGIKNNMPLVSHEGVAGKIVETGPYASKAILLSDPDLKIAAACLRTREEGIVVGVGQGFCRMIYLSRDSDVAVGDMIVTAGYSGIFPKNLLIGKVTDIKVDPRHLYKYAVIKPAVNIFKLEEVLCLE